MSDAFAISAADVAAAAERLRGIAVVTPLLESPLLNAALGFRLLVKAEPLQKTGSFKFRGAYNRIVQLDAQQRARGVVAFSSGNHAQGIAHAAQLLGVPAIIVMPADAPAMKIANTRAYGAEVVTYDRWTEDREAIGRAIAEPRGMVVVPPYDDPHIMAGQGTVGLEIVDQCAAVGIVPDAVIANASGGGLMAGIATAVKARLPATKIYVAEPEGFDDHRRSLAAGTQIANAQGAQSFCDALLAAQPGKLTFPINRALLAGGVTVSDAEVEIGIATAAARLKLVVEPGGAVAFTAAVLGRLDLKGRTVVVVASGGNIDPDLLSAILGRTTPH